MVATQTKILIVDDEELNLEILGEYLENSNYELAFARDGQEAIDTLNAKPHDFDIVLLDWMMPKLSGLEVLEQMKAHPDLMHIPVILQTAAASKQDIVKGLQAGAYYYLPKPFAEDILKTIVASAISDRKRYQLLCKEIENKTEALTLLKNCCFQFRTLTDVKKLSAFLARMCPAPEKTIMGLSELMINSIEHGNLEITYEEKSVLNKEGRWKEEVEKRLQNPLFKDRYAEVQCTKDHERITFRIIDQGQGFSWDQYLDIAPNRAFDTHGRGIAIAKAVSFNDIEYMGCGNEVIATVYTNQ